MAVQNIEHISAADKLQPLYVIHGEEDLLRVEALDKLRAAAKQQGYLNREVYTADNAFDWNEMLASANSMGLFADLKLMEIHIPNGKPGKTGAEALLSLAENLPDDTVTVVMLPKLEKAQTQAKWFAAMARQGVVLEAKAVSGNALPDPACRAGGRQPAGSQTGNRQIGFAAPERQHHQRGGCRAGRGECGAV